MPDEDLYETEYWEEDELLECHNHCDWTGTLGDLDNPSEDEYRCPKCGGSVDMIISAAVTND